jgi:hypothetical protein
VLVVVLTGCSAALTSLTPEQAAGLKEAQRVADEVTKAYGVPGVRVYATLNMRPTTAGAYSYRYDWIFVRPDVLTGDRFWLVLGHELGHATMKHRDQIDGPPDRVRATRVRHEAEANRRGVEIMVRFGGVTQREALERYATYFIEGNRRIDGRNVSLGIGHQLPCVELRDLWSSFNLTAPPCEAFTATPEIKDCPYDDWINTGCRAGEPLAPGAGR